MTDPDSDYIADLATTVARVAPLLLALPLEVVSRRPAPGKWSAQEVLGHLIDSASHNHQRFVRAQWKDDLIFVGYDQETWVRFQDYQNASWSDLVVLWHAYNAHLARVMAATPIAVRTRQHARHNLHELAWRPVPTDRPATLNYFMEDYVAHLHHHLRQIASLTGQAQL